MNGRLGLISMVLMAAPWAALGEGRLLNQLMEAYGQIESVTCDVRRDLSNEDGNLRWLSRVHFARPDRLHVENFAPLPRRIISDGHTMYQHNEGQPRGFRRAVAELPEPMLHNLRRVPGTAMDHLFRLRGVEEIELEGAGAFPVWRGYVTDTVYVILQADPQGRLGRIQLFDAQDRERMTGDIQYEGFEEVVEGVWIPMLHRGRFWVGGLETRETTRISNFHANTSIPAHLFDAAPFFKPDVQWVDRFEAL